MYNGIPRSSSIIGRGQPFVINNARQKSSRLFSSSSPIPQSQSQSQTAATTSNPITTPYTIDCAPTKPDELIKIITKHCWKLDAFLEHQPIAAHTLEAFEKLQAIVPRNATIILDSGCGTGRSSRHIGNALASHTVDHDDDDEEEVWVLGIDRSLVRLEKNEKFRQQRDEANATIVDDDDVVWTGSDDTDSSSSSKNSNGNVLYIRAELVSFWRLLLKHQDTHGWTLKTHYLLYPNPYPKTKRLKSRWYGHPSFPLILQLSGEDIVVRSNWEQYLIEFAESVVIADQIWSSDSATSGHSSSSSRSINYARPYVESAKQGPVRREPENNIGWSNFERKMDAVGEATYELHLKRSE